MRHLIVGLLAASALSATRSQQTFAGVITDSMCATGDHAPMQMGPTDAECTVACVRAHGAAYVLFDGRDAYALSDQETPERFAGQKVRIVGTLDAATRTIQVDSMTAAG